MKKILLLSILFISCDKPYNEKSTIKVENHFERLSNVYCQVVTTNLYNKETVAINTSLNSLGYMVSSDGNCTSEFISLEPNTTYSFSGAKGLGNYNYLYDSNYVQTRSLGAIKAGTFTTSDNELYARFTVGDAGPGTGYDRGLLQLNIGQTVDYLQPYNFNRCINWTDEFPENAVFVLIHAGQSNPWGACNTRTGGSYLSERQATNKILRWNTTSNTFVNQNLSISGNHGIDLFLQKKIYKLNRPFYYINTAISNTVMSKHLPPLGTVFLTANAAVTTAINQLIAQGKRPFVWYVFGQGEGDSSQSTLTNAYANRQLQYLNFWKNKLGQNVPFIFSGINVHGSSLQQSLDTAINQTKINLDAQGLVRYYPVTDFTTDAGNQEHRNYNGYNQEAQVVWNLINDIRPVEITQPLTQ